MTPTANPAALQDPSLDGTRDDCNAPVLRAPVLVRGPVPDLPGMTRAGERLALLSPEPVATLGNRHYAMDGAAIAAGTVVLRNADIQAALPAHAANGSLRDLAEWWAPHVVNPSCLFVLDASTEEALCLPDPLGGALAFAFSGGGYDFISSDIVSLVHVAGLVGITLKKSVEFQAERLIVGNGGLTPASYDGVRRLEIFEYWAMDAATTVPKEYGLAEEMRSADVSYVEVMRRLREQVLESVAAISAIPSDYRVGHLTGGFDSRLVFAAMVEAGCTDAFNYFCSGPPGTVDRIISDNLSASFGLNRGISGGLTAAPTDKVSERLLAPLFYSGGMIPTGPTGRELPTTVVASGGGYGEVLRTFYGPRFKPLDQENFSSSDLMDLMAPKLRGRESIFTQAARDDIGSRLHREWTRLSESGEPADFIGDALYSRIRNRYHIGQGSLLWSRIGARFDPLYSVYGYQLARSLPLEARASNVIGFDLMDSFDGQLRSYPFDKNRFSETYAAMRRVPEPREVPPRPFRGEPRSFTPPFRSGEVLPRRLAGIQVNEVQATAAQRQAFVAKAKKIGVNYWQVAALSSAQKALKVALETVDFSAIDHTVNNAYMHKLSTGRVEHRQDVRAVYSAFDLIAWLGE